MVYHNIVLVVLVSLQDADFNISILQKPFHWLPFVCSKLGPGIYDTGNGIHTSIRTSSGSAFMFSNLTCRQGPAGGPLGERLKACIVEYL